MKKYLTLFAAAIVAAALLAGCGSHGLSAEDSSIVTSEGAAISEENAASASGTPGTVYLTSTRTGAVTKVANPVVGIEFDSEGCTHYNIEKTNSNFRVQPFNSDEAPVFVMFDSPDEIVIGDFEYGFATAISTRLEDMIHIYDLENQLVYKVVTPKDTNQIKKISDRKFVVRCGNPSDGFHMFSFSTSQKYAYDLFSSAKDDIMIVDGGHEYDVVKEVAEQEQGATTLSNEKYTQSEEPAGTEQQPTRFVEAEANDEPQSYEEADVSLNEETEEPALDGTDNQVMQEGMQEISQPDETVSDVAEPTVAADGAMNPAANDNAQPGFEEADVQPIVPEEAANMEEETAETRMANSLFSFAEETGTGISAAAEAITSETTAADSDSFEDDLTATDETPSNGELPSEEGSVASDSALQSVNSEETPNGLDAETMEAVGEDGDEEEEIETTVIYTANDRQQITELPQNQYVNTDPYLAAVSNAAPGRYPDQNKTIIDAPKIPQYPNYPTGCESVSTVMALQYHGINLSVDDFVNTYLDKSIDFYIKNGVKYGPSPYEYFIGNPYDSSGFGCYAPVIYNSLTRILENTNLRPVNCSGHTMTDLCIDYIDQNLPVMVWVNIGMSEAIPTNTWHIESDDSEFVWLCNEHCMLLVGYDDTNYYFNDPSTGQMVTYGREISEKCYEQQGMQSVVIMN